MCERDSVEQFEEVTPDHLWRISELFEAIDGKYAEARDLHKKAPHFFYLTEDLEVDPPFKPTSTFGVAKNYKELVETQAGQVFTITVPLVEDPPFEHFTPNIGADNLDRWARIVMRRGHLFEALFVRNFRIENFGNGETEDRIAMDGLISQSRQRLEPSERLELVTKRIKMLPPAPLRY